jgi:hypothetical protein
MRHLLLMAVLLILVGCSTPSLKTSQSVMAVPVVVSHRVLVIIPTRNYVEKACLDAVLKQDYEDYSVLINIVKNPAPTIQTETSVRSTINRNKARQMALSSDADYFLFLDSDVVLPTNAISSFGLQLSKTKIEIICGWYKTKVGDHWVAGNWVADNTFQNFLQPAASVVKTDMIGLGCVMMKRQVLADVEFRDGTTTEAKFAEGAPMYLGPCLQFGNDCADKGRRAFMDGDVVCGHIDREKNP